MTTVPEAIEVAVHAMARPTKFMAGTKMEVNAILDNINVTSYPVAILIHPYLSKPELSRQGHVSRTYQITMHFLDRFEQYQDSMRNPNKDANLPNGFKSSLSVVEAQRMQVNSFIVAMRSLVYSAVPTSPLYDARYVGAPIFKPITNKPFIENELINRYSENLFGVELIMQLDTFYNDSFC
jgi:hypothetical protein